MNSFISVTHNNEDIGYYENVNLWKLVYNAWLELGIINKWYFSKSRKVNNSFVKRHGWFLCRFLT